MTSPLTIVTWLWQPRAVWGTTARYTWQQVGAVQAMVAAHYHAPYRFVCVTDQPGGLPCETIPLVDLHVASPKREYPDCWRRLWAFSPDAANILGPRIASIDLDVLILDDITSLFDTEASFKILRGTACPYNGSLWLHQTGTHPEVWTDFDPATSPQEAHAQFTAKGQRYYGSDQAWLSLKLPGRPTWTQADGIYQYRHTFWLQKGQARLQIPPDCRMVFFAGNIKPWSEAFWALNPVLQRQYKQYLRAGTEALAG